jgi:glyoxylase-like metal-dependent hydrolase (beta-lactamase superfamily II)
MPGYKISIGNCEIVSLTDAQMQFPWNMIFPSISEADREPYRELYPYCYGDVGFRTDAGAYAVRSSGKTVLVDTGIGPGPIAMLGGLEGKMIEDMKSKGITPEEVDIVVHTHLHFDHVSWNLTKDGKPTFPNATYYAPGADLTYFEANLQANPQMASVLPLRDMGKLQTYSGETTLTPDITTIPTPGHTPGHHSVLVASGGEKAIVTGDVAHHPMQMDHTEWSPAFDVDPQASAATRKALADRMENEGIVAAFCHFPGEGFGRITRSGSRRVFQAL